MGVRLRDSDSESGCLVPQRKEVKRTAAAAIRGIIRPPCPSERVQRRIDQFLDEAEEALGRNDWTLRRQRAQAVLALDDENEDARTYLRAARNGQLAAPADSRETTVTSPPVRTPDPEQSTSPSSFAAGRYEVRRFLGEGGKKRVYLAHDSLLDRDVAFALIRTEGLDETGRERVRREAQALARLGGHPHLVTIHDIGDEGGQPFSVMEYMAGGSVADAVSEAEEHRLPLERTLEIATAVSEALTFVHAGNLVHRDVKPGNVFLGEDGTAKLGDFGLAAALDRTRLTQDSMVMGTAAYMPPEQALGGEVTPQSDLYSLGAMLYEMVTGRTPFVGDDPTSVISQHINTPPVAPSWHTEHCPPDLEEIILHCLQKAPDDRPESAGNGHRGAWSRRPDGEVGESLGLRREPARPAGPGSLRRARAASWNDCARPSIVRSPARDRLFSLSVSRELERHARLRSWRRSRACAERRCCGVGRTSPVALHRTGRG